MSLNSMSESPIYGCVGIASRTKFVPGDSMNIAVGSLHIRDKVERDHTGIRDSLTVCNQWSRNTTHHKIGGMHGLLQITTQKGGRDEYLMPTTGSEPISTNIVQQSQVNSRELSRKIVRTSE